MDHSCCRCHGFTDRGNTRHGHYNREAMCVPIKEWPLDSLQGCHTGPLKLRSASGPVQNEGQRWQVCSICPCLTLMYLISCSSMTSQVRSTEEQPSLDLRYGQQMGSCLQKGNCVLFRLSTLHCLARTQAQMGALCLSAAGRIPSGMAQRD